MTLVAIVVAAALVVELILKPPLYSDQHAIGMHAVALLIPYVGAMSVATWAAATQQRRRTQWLGSAAAFLVLVIPFADILAMPVVHLEGDDSYRYSVYAHNMLRERTLWGSDQLMHGFDRSRAYLDQPGYRYYLAAAIAVLDGEHRGLQLANMAVLLAVMLLLFDRMRDENDVHRGPPATPEAIPTRKTRALGTPEAPRGVRGIGNLHGPLFFFFALASAPYAAKNIIYGYSEWLAVAVFALGAWAYLTNRYRLAIICVGLAPFLRQNLVLVSVVIAAAAIVKTRRWYLAALYVAVLALPIYHNLYYAHAAAFFVENTGVAAPMTRSIWKDVAIKLTGYAGYMPGEKLLTLLIAVFFTPLGVTLIAWEIVAADAKQRALLLLVVVATVGPTLLFGDRSYPRFEFVNLWVILLSFHILRTSAAPATVASITPPK